MRVGDDLNLIPDFFLVKPESCKPGRIMASAHMANLVGPPLEREDPAADEGPDQIVRLDLFGFHQLGDVCQFWRASGVPAMYAGRLMKSSGVLFLT